MSSSSCMTAASAPGGIPASSATHDVSRAAGSAGALGHRGLLACGPGPGGGPGMSGAVFTAYLGLDYPLPDRFLSARLRRLAEARRETHGNEDQAAVFVVGLADAIRRRDRPGEVGVSHLDAAGMAEVTAALEDCLRQARAQRDSTWPRMQRLYDHWTMYARGW